VSNATDVIAFIEPWEKCNNCKQPFMGQLSIDLASEFESFAEATYGQQNYSSKWDKMNILAAIRIRIEASQKFFALTQSGDMVEWNKLVRKLLSMVDQTKKDFHMNGWDKMPKDSDEYKYDKMLCLILCRISGVDGSDCGRMNSRINGAMQ
jgi:hypothetical protein